MNQVNLIQLVGLSEFTGSTSGIGYIAVVVIGNIAVDLLCKGAHRARNGILEFRQIDQGQCVLVGTACALLSLCAEVIDDQLADFKRAHGAVGSELCQPVRVIPACARLGLFRSQQIVAVRFHRNRGFHICHQTCVKADDIKLDAACLEGSLDSVHRHGAVGIKFIIAVAGNGSSAMIPEDKDVAVCRIVRGAIADEFSQGGRIGHCLAAEI